MSDKPTTWSGWTWDRKRGWRRVCSASTLAECSTLLEKARGKVPSHHCVCKAGKAGPAWLPKAGTGAG